MQNCVEDMNEEPDQLLNKFNRYIIQSAVDHGTKFEERGDVFALSSALFSPPKSFEHAPHFKFVQSPSLL